MEQKLAHTDTPAEKWIWGRGGGDERRNLRRWELRFGSENAREPCDQATASAATPQRILLLLLLKTRSEARAEDRERGSLS